MSPYDHSDPHEPAVRSNFLASRAGLVLLGFVLIAGALLFTEHRAHVLGVLVWLPNGYVPRQAGRGIAVPERIRLLIWVKRLVGRRFIVSK